MTRILVYLLNLIFVIILGWIVSRVFRGLFGSPRSHIPGSRPGAVGDNPANVVRGETARDPVCGMFVSTELSHRLTRGKETLHFCSHECLEQFQRDAKKS